MAAKLAAEAQRLLKVLQRQEKEDKKKLEADLKDLDKCKKMPDRRKSRKPDQLED